VSAESPLCTPSEAAATETPQLGMVVFASSLGTVFEWYEFFLFGAMASIIAAQFFASVGETAGFVFTLLTFAAGFAMRPLGALVFGSIGDRLGRKVAFLVTIVLMGASTVGIGLLPTYAQVGALAPALLVTLRMAQGIALGGEYGGAATYVAEHAPANRRGYYTSLIHAAAALGLIAALLIIYVTRKTLGEETFRDWGWRIPFVISALVLALSIWARTKLEESPAFRVLKQQGKTAKAPLLETLGRWRNLRLVLIALFGFMAADGAIWYASHFYAQFFLERSLRVESSTVNLLFIFLSLTAAPLYVAFGALSDRIGRKPVVVAGIAAALVIYLPTYQLLANAANPALARAAAQAPVRIGADPADCSLQFDPLGTKRFASSCDIAKRALARAGVGYEMEPAAAGRPARITIGSEVIESVDARRLAPAAAQTVEAEVERRLLAALRSAGYPQRADPSAIRIPLILLGLLLLVVPAAAIYGPLGAALVELFPTRVRYTAMSLPYHIGTGWFGGFMPAIAFMMVAESGNMLAGLKYVIAIAAVSLLVAVPFWHDSRGRDLMSEA
jgi:predicted MFS family arabinose efflux permease